MHADLSTADLKQIAKLERLALTDLRLASMDHLVPSGGTISTDWLGGSFPSVARG
jgi:hypothetical protein